MFQEPTYETPRLKVPFGGRARKGSEYNPFHTQCRLWLHNQTNTRIMRMLDKGRTKGFTTDKSDIVNAMTFQAIDAVYKNGDFDLYDAMRFLDQVETINANIKTDYGSGIKKLK